MFISIEYAADYLGVVKDTIYGSERYKKHVVDRRNKKMFNISEYEKVLEKEQEEFDYCIDITNYTDWLIEELGEDNFYSSIPSKIRQEVERGLEKNKLSYSISKQIHELFKDSYDKYLNSDFVEEVSDKSENSNNYIPIEEREPLTESYIMENFWAKERTAKEIAKELNVPASWVNCEIKRLGLEKKINGIKKRSHMKGKTLSKEERKKRECQPHAKPIVQICPVTFKIVREFSSQGAVERSGFKREGVRKAIKRAGLHRGFLWALKDFHKPIINNAAKRGNLESKLQANLYQKPSKKLAKKYYIDRDYTAERCAEIFKCSGGTFSRLAKEYGLSKRKKKINIDKKSNKQEKI